MKVKTSVTLSEELITEIDRRSGRSKNRSAVVERAVREYLRVLSRQRQDERDRELYNRHADELSSEALEALSFQVDR